MQIVRDDHAPAPRLTRSRVTPRSRASPGLPPPLHPQVHNDGAIRRLVPRIANGGIDAHGARRGVDGHAVPLVDVAAHIQAGRAVADKRCMGGVGVRAPEIGVFLVVRIGQSTHKINAIKD